MGKEEALRFKKKRKEIPVVFEDGDGKDVTFTLREMSDGLRDVYMDELQERGIFGIESAAVKSFSGIQRSLVSKCLYDDKGQLVTQDVLKDEFPATVVTALFMKAAEMNGLSEEAYKKAKNASRAKPTNGTG